MKIIKKQNDDLPQLAWLIDFDINNSILTMELGKNVEKGDNFIVEGVWDGDFSEGKISESANFFGSGVCINADSIILVPSCSTTDGLFYQKNKDRIIAANSLPLLLAHLDDSLIEDYTEYGQLNNSVIEGIRKYKSKIPTVQGSIERLVYFNLHVQKDNISKIEKGPVQKFESYMEYKNYLYSTYEKIFSNSQSEQRKQALGVISTQSRGYDSTATNAIASNWRIDCTYTVKQSKGKNAWALNDKAGQLSDDGSDICQTLDIPCQPINRSSFQNGFDDEEWFHAANHINEDMNMLDMLTASDNPRILLTGVFGELWYTSEGLKQWRDATSDDLMRADLGMHGLSEIRLKTGFIQLAMPAIGARSRVDILRISESEEMAPWSLDQAYNRPIPRRLAEEEGVGREMFGQIKMASTVSLPRPTCPVTPELKEEYLNHLVKTGQISLAGKIFWPLFIKINHYIYFHSPYKYRLLYYIERVISKVIGKKYSFPIIYKKLEGSIYSFAVNKMIGFYKSKLTTETPDNRAG